MPPPEPYCAACCHVVDNLTGIRPHPAQDTYLCLSCWDRMSVTDQALVRIHLEMLSLVGARALSFDEADWRIEADAAEANGLLLAPTMAKQVAAWSKSWRATASKPVRDAIEKMIGELAAVEAAKAKAVSAAS